MNVVGSKTPLTNSSNYPQQHPTVAIATSTKSQVQRPFHDDTPLIQDLDRVRNFKELAELMQETSRQCDCPYEPSKALINKLGETVLRVNIHSPKSQLNKNWTINWGRMLCGFSQFAGTSEHLDKFLSFTADYIEQCEYGEFSVWSICNVIHGLSHLEPSEGIKRLLSVLERQLEGADTASLTTSGEVYIAEAIISLSPLLQQESEEAIFMIKSLSIKLSNLLKDRVDFYVPTTSDTQKSVVMELLSHTHKLRVERNVEWLDINLHDMSHALAKFYTKGLCEALAAGEISAKNMCLIYGKGKHRRDQINVMKGMVKTIYEQHEAQIAHQWSKQYRNGHMTIVRNKQAQKIAIPEDRESELKAQLRRQAIERPILSNTNRSVSADLTITVHQFTPKRQDENSMPDSTRTQQLQWKLQDQLMRLRTELNSNAAKRKIEVVSPNDNGASPNKKQRTDTSTDTVRVTLLSSQHLMQEEAVT